MKSTASITRPLALFALVMAAALCLFATTGCIKIETPQPPASTSGSTSSSETESSSETTGTDEAGWPQNDLTEGVPRPAFDSTPSIIEGNGLVSFTYAGIPANEADAYLQELKDAGFTQVEADSNVLGTVSYVARNADTGTHMSYSFSSSSGSLTLSLDRIGL